MIKQVFKRYFGAGLLVFVPLILTLLILKWIIHYADSFLMDFLPDAVLPINLFGFHVPGLGLVATILLILFIGFLTRVYIGKKLIHWGERLVARIPVGRSLYSGIKQFMQTFFSENSQFKGVAVVEFPRKDSWVLAFITGDVAPQLQAAQPEKKWLNVFIPTTPNPTNGFWIMVPENEVYLVDVSIDYAFKLVISGGTVQEILATRMSKQK